MSRAKQNATTVNGSCLCGSVQYSVTGLARRAVLCHCDNCRRTSGSAFAHNAPFLKAEIRYQKGEDHVKDYADSNTKTGNTLHRHFCDTCGSPIYLVNSAVEGLIIVHAGLISNLENERPGMELFEENRRAWLDGLRVAKL